MTKPLVYLIILSLVYSPLAYSNQFMEAAKEAVKEHHIATSTRVDNLLITTIGESLQSFSASLSDLDKTKNLRDKYIAQMQQVQSDLNSFLNGAENEGEVSLASVEEAYQTYLDLYASYINNSWLPGTIEQQFQNVPAMLRHSVKDLRFKCTTGIDDVNFPPLHVSLDQLPEFDYEMSVYLKVGSLDTASYSSADYDVTTYYEVNDTEKALMDVSQIAFATSSIMPAAQGAAYLGYWFAGGVKAGGAAFTGTAGSLTSTSWAVMPYAAAAMVAVAYAMSYSAKRKMSKMQDQKAKADIYKLENSRSDAYLKKEFTEKCTRFLPIIDSIITDLDFVTQNFGNSEAIASYYESDLEKLKSSNEQLAKKANAESALALQTYYNDKKCVTLEKLQEIDPNKYLEEKKEFPPCFTVDGRAGLLSNKYSLAIVDDKNLDMPEKYEADLEIFTKVEEGKRIEDEMAAFEATKDHIRLMIYTSLVQNYQAVMSSFKNYFGNHLHEQRKQAFRRLLKLIGIYQQQNEKSVSEKLEKELEIFKKYVEFDSELKSLTASAIFYTFGSISKQEYKKEAKQFRDSFSPFYEKYLHVREVRALMDQLIRLEDATGIVRK